MGTRSVRFLAAAVLAVTVLSMLPTHAQGFTVLPGWDLFATDPGRTSFGPIPVLAPPLMANCQGVPLSSFDFPGVGTFGTGPTDTIVQRLGTATPADPVVPVELVALQLHCNLTINSNSTPLDAYVTLQSDRGRNPLDPPSCCNSTGTLNIQFDASGQGGFAQSQLGVHYDVRIGSLNGPIINLGGGLIGDTASLAGSAPWVHALPPGVIACLDELGILARHGVIDAAFYIAAVNYLLNGIDPGDDFHYGELNQFCDRA